MHTCYLRPGEARGLRCEDLLPPVPGARRGLCHWSLVVAPAHRGETTKTLASDDTIILDALPFLGPLLADLCQNQRPLDLLFRHEQALFMQQWDFLIAGMKLPRTNLYQLRHGGAAHDYLTKKRPLLEVMARGRWSSTSTLLRYAKAGKDQ